MLGPVSFSCIPACGQDDWVFMKSLVSSKGKGEITSTDVVFSTEEVKFRVSAKRFLTRDIVRAFKFSNHLEKEYPYCEFVRSSRNEKGKTSSSIHAFFYKEGEKVDIFLLEDTRKQFISFTDNFPSVSDVFSLFNIEYSYNESLNKYTGMYKYKDVVMTVLYNYSRLTLRIDNAHKYTETDYVYGAKYIDPECSVNFLDIKDIDIEDICNKVYKDRHGICIKEGSLGT